MPLPLQRLTAWLCLLAALIAGSTPARGFVVCLEPDGCVSMELAELGSGCDGCDGHELPSEAQQPVTHAEDAGSCPCVDFLLTVAPQCPRLVPKSLEPASVALPAPALAILPQLLAPRAARGSAPPRPAPRPPDELACLATVVLRR